MADKNEKRTISRRSLLFGGLNRFKENVVPNLSLSVDPDKSAGDAALWKRDYAGAAACYKRCLAGSPDHAEARSRLGFCCLRQGDLDAAIAEFGAVLRREPKHNFTRLYLGLAYARKGDLASTVTVWREYFNPSQLTLQREINIQTALLQTDEPPTADEVVKAVEAAIEEQRRILES
jgi:tetratricopeptide (TPR) repeat protein